MSNLIIKSIEQEMEDSYLEYAISVIVSRAIPDVRDGLKPVHRRIIYSMKENSCNYNRSYRKSARIVGDVMGKYHPHGDVPIYDAMVRMAQPFAMGNVLIDGQGNFGSIDADAPAAMRYTEARMSKIAHEIVDDIDYDTVYFVGNYDSSTIEPTVLPSRIPNLLLNGATGIAVGVATNIPSHNLSELMDLCCAYVDNNNLTVEEIMQIMPGPDFPTGGTILGHEGIRNYYSTGKGSIAIRSKTSVEKNNNRESIIVNEIPYQTNKAKLVEQIAVMVNDGSIEDIQEIRDESDKDGIRIVIDLKKNADSDIILNQLYKNTQMQTSIGVNLLAIEDRMPKMMSVLQVIKSFINFRIEVVTRKIEFLLRNLEKRSNLLVALSVAASCITEIVEMIKSSPDVETAKDRLIKKNWPLDQRLIDLLSINSCKSIIFDNNIKLTEEQAQNILDLRLQKLTGLEREKILSELSDNIETMNGYIHLLNNKDSLLFEIKKDFIAIKNEFGTTRKTDIISYGGDINDDQLVQSEDIVITISNLNYIKRVGLEAYKAQHRGGKGKTGMSTKEEDAMKNIMIANTKDELFFFSDKGYVYSMKAYKLPQGDPRSKGRVIANILQMDADENIATVLAISNEINHEEKTIIFCTQSGCVKRNRLSDFTKIKASGKIAIKLDENDKLIRVAVCNSDEDYVVIATRNGKCIVFKAEELRIFSGRNSAGVLGAKLSKDDRVVSMLISQHNDEETLLLTFTENGYAKCTPIIDYRITNRGAQGVKNIDMSDKNGHVVDMLHVCKTDEVVIATNKGNVLRCLIDEIRVSGRATKGVILCRMDIDESLVSASKLV